MGLPSMLDSCSSMPMVSSAETAVDRLTTQSSQWAMVVKGRTISRSEILGELDGESRATSVSLKRVVLRELHASFSMHLLCPPCPLLWRFKCQIVLPAQSSRMLLVRACLGTISGRL